MEYLPNIFNIISPLLIVGNILAISIGAIQGYIDYVKEKLR